MLREHASAPILRVLPARGGVLLGRRGVLLRRPRRRYREHEQHQDAKEGEHFFSTRKFNVDKYHKKKDDDAAGGLVFYPQRGAAENKVQPRVQEVIETVF